MEKNNCNCWEHWNCSPADRDSCPAYIMGMGRECWLVANSMVGYVSGERMEKKFQNCWDCPWFKKMSHCFEKRT